MTATHTIDTETPGDADGDPAPHRDAPPLPGDRTMEESLERMIRVDHAGEYGAVQIYKGQLAVMGSNPRLRRSIDKITHMAEQEREHLDTFDRLIAERKVRPTLLSPLWRGAGYALGAGTALLGERAAMACTAAVEEVIDEHYAQQARELGDQDPELKATIEKFRADEAEHRQTALDEGAESAPGYALLSGAIKAGCRLAIRLAERI